VVSAPSRLPRVAVRTLIAFGLGLVGGVIIDRLLISSGVGGVVAALGGLGVFAIGVLALILPELAEKEREDKGLFREHSDLLNSQVFSVIPSGRTRINANLPRTDLPPEGEPDFGWTVSGSGERVRLIDLPNWDLAFTHINSADQLRPIFESTMGRLTKRVQRKADLDRAFVERLTLHVQEVYGAGFVYADNFTDPSPPKWFDGVLLTSWLRAGNPGNYNYVGDSTEGPHQVMAGNRAVLTSDDVLTAPPAKFISVYTACRTDPSLGNLWGQWGAEDRADQEQVNAFAATFKHFSERITATHRLPGRCDICDEFRSR
jgi:hypothetical protein